MMCKDHVVVLVRMRRVRRGGQIRSQRRRIDMCPFRRSGMDFYWNGKEGYTWWNGVYCYNTEGLSNDESFNYYLIILQKGVIFVSMSIR